MFSVWLYMLCTNHLCFQICILLPRDAKLARYLLWHWVCPSVRHKPLLYQNG